MATLVAALVISALLLVSRLDLARVVALADAEALFVAYGLHPQPAYLDHPGLIGWLAARLGTDAPPDVIHNFTAIGATLLPWVGVLAARASGAAPRAALRTYFPLALIPELAIGSFAFGPGLPLAFFWLLALGAAGWASRHSASTFGTLLACSAAGIAAALASLSKVSGWLLALSLLCVWLGKGQAARWRTLGPWAAVGLFAILVMPLLRWHLRGGPLPGLDLTPEPTQAALRLLRPLFSVGPPFLYAGVLIALHLRRHQSDSAVHRLFWWCLLVPLVPQALLGIFARGDVEWLAPAYLTLAVYAAHAPPLRVSLERSCIALGMIVGLLGWGWLRTDLPVRTARWLGGYEPLVDISNDLYSWGPGRELLENAVYAARERTGQTPIVIGPHWAVCAQADVALAGTAVVGCDSAELDDYDIWSNASTWSQAQTILYVTDSRFHETPPETFQGRLAVATHGATVTRFGRNVRQISISEFEREATAAAPR